MAALTPPATPGHRNLRVIKPVSVSQNRSPFSFAEQTYDHGGDLLVFEVTLPRMTRAQADPWDAFFTSLRASAGLLEFSPKLLATAKGALGGTPLVDGASQTGRSLATKGWSTGVTGILKAGDWIQLNTGDSREIHMITADADSDGSGLSTLGIFPKLRTSPAGDSSVVTTTPTGIFRLAGQAPEFDYQSDQLTAEVKFRLVEAINRS